VPGRCFALVASTCAAFDWTMLSRLVGRVLAHRHAVLRSPLGPSKGEDTFLSSVGATGSLVAMSAYAPQKMLQRVSLAKKRDIEHWNEGLHLEKNSGRTIADLRQRAIADRWTLANSFRRNADRMMALEPPLYRDAISRYYYAMYHAMRSVVYFAEGGDDYQAHSNLPGHAPADLADAEQWQNVLKDARERRNAVDYDAYPKSGSAYSKVAYDLQTTSTRFLSVTRAYLRARGCGHI